MEKETKTFTITAPPNVLRRIERFLALLHWNSAFGHSSIFAIPLDGDGPERVVVDPVPDYRADVDKLAGVGYDVEIAYEREYTGHFIDRLRPNGRWVARDGQIHKHPMQP